MKRLGKIMFLAMLTFSVISLTACGNKTENSAGGETEEKTPKIDTSSGGASEEEQTAAETAGAVEELSIEYDNYLINANFKDVMKGGSETDHAEASERIGDGAQVSFVTDVANGDENKHISGMIFIGSESELFDFSEEDFYTDEDYEKMEADPEYVPTPVFPTAEDVVSNSLSSMSESSGLKDAKVAGIDMKAGSGYTVVEDRGNAYCIYYAFGTMEDGRIAFVTASASATGCTDAKAAIEDAQQRIDNWVTTLSIDTVEA